MIELFEYVRIFESSEAIANCFNFSLTCFISLNLRIMDRAIKLNNKIVGRTTKIDNERRILDSNLPPKLYAKLIITQSFSQKMLGCGFSTAQFTHNLNRNLSFISFVPHHLCPFATLDNETETRNPCKVSVRRSPLPRNRGRGDRGEGLPSHIRQHSHPRRFR